MAPQNKMLENMDSESPATIVPTVTRYVEPLQNDSEKEKTEMEKTDSSNSYVNKAFENDTSTDERPRPKEEQKENNLKDIDLNMDTPVSENMDFDDILPHIGEFGKYQKLLFLMMIPFAFFVAFVYFTQIFITLVPEEHFCYVPELQNLTKEER